MKRFRISKKSIALSFLVSLIFPSLIIFMMSPMIHKTMVAESSEEAFKVATYLAYRLNLKKNLLSKGTFSDKLINETKHIKESFGLYKANIISANGMIIFSTDPRTTGTTTDKELINKLISRGEQHAAFKEKGSLSYEGIPLNADIVEASVPIMISGRPIGAIEVYYNITQIHSDFHKLQIVFSLTLFAVSFFGVFGIILFLRKAEHRRMLQVQAEKELTTEKIRAETVFSSMNDNIIIQDRNYKIIYQNKINRDAFGDRLGEHCYKVYEGLDQVCDFCPIELSYQDGESHKYEKEVVTGKGPLYFELTSSPLRNADGDIIAGIKLVRDITEKRRLEEQLRHAQKMEAIGTLASGISHEFNNILTTVIGFSELILDQISTDDPSRKYLEAIYSSGTRAETLTRGLLTYSRKHAPDKTPISLNRTILGIQEILSQIIGSDIEMNISLPVDDMTVTADKNQIEQVLINIITNSRDAMPSGGDLNIALSSIEVDGEFTKTHGFGTRGRSYACIGIRDTGCGMPHETVESIFEPFFTTKDVGKGTGLGLSIVYNIVKNHDGHLDVQSALGKGTEFSIYLPF